MKKIFLMTVIALSTSVMAKTNMNLEGACQGKLHDKTSVAFTYYSDFDGCKEKSQAGITFSRASSTITSGLSTGERYFTDTHDIYSFKDKKISFANSTGNTTGRFTYRDQQGKVRTVTLACNVRNYEYADCR